MLSEETVKEFREIFKKDYGVELTSQEASKAAHDIVAYFDLLAQIDARNKEDGAESTT
jgi:hypothetical protein